MRLRDYTHRDHIFVINEQCSKLRFLELVVSLVKEQKPDLDQQVVLERLLAREAQVTTGIGHGVAIPHARVDSLEELSCFIIRAPGGIEYESLDQAPIHVAFLLLSPPKGTGGYIRLLARIARLADRAGFVQDIAQAADADEVYSLIVEEDLHHV